jgi:hypothetical protein
MNFKDLLKKPNIKKTVDPGSGDSISPLTNQNIIPEIPREISTTPIKSLVEDVISIASTTQFEIKQTIDDIYNTNKSDPGFLQYNELVNRSFFDPLTLLTNPNARPSQIVTINHIKLAERDVYHRVVDPRAPFLADLHRMREEAGVIQYTFTKVWDNITNPNQLYDDFEDNRLARYSIYKDRDYLNQLRVQNSRVQNNFVSSVQEALAKGLLRRIYDQVTFTESHKAAEKVDKIIQTLKQLREVSRAAIILQNANWETFQNLITDTLGNIINRITLRTIMAQNYALYGGLYNKISEFTQGLEELTGIDTFDIPELLEFRLQVDSVFREQANKIENDLIKKEKDSAELENLRSHLYANSIKTSKTKQMVDGLDHIIQELNHLRAKLLTGDTFTEIQIEKVIASMKKRNQAYTQQVVVAPPSNILTTVLNNEISNMVKT